MTAWYQTCRGSFHHFQMFDSTCINTLMPKCPNLGILCEIGRQSDNFTSLPLHIVLKYDTLMSWILTAHITTGLHGVSCFSRCWKYIICTLVDHLATVIGNIELPHSLNQMPQLLFISSPNLCGVYSRAAFIDISELEPRPQATPMFSMYMVGVACGRG